MQITVEEVESSRGEREKYTQKNRKKRPVLVWSQEELDLIWDGDWVLRGQCIVLKSLFNLQSYTVLHYTIHMSTHIQVVLGLYTISLSADGLYQNIFASSLEAAVPKCTTRIMGQRKADSIWLNDFKSVSKCTQCASYFLHQLYKLVSGIPLPQLHTIIQV